MGKSQVKRTGTSDLKEAVGKLERFVRERKAKIEGCLVVGVGEDRDRQERRYGEKAWTRETDE